jgi:hypothetical protein
MKSAFQMLKQKPQITTTTKTKSKHTNIISAAETAAKGIPKITTQIAKQVMT